jgi:hypothetical protein
MEIGALGTSASRAFRADLGNIATGDKHLRNPVIGAWNQGLGVNCQSNFLTFFDVKK